LNKKMRERVQQDVGAARELALTLPILHPVLMSTRKGIETFLDWLPCEPTHHGSRTELDEDALPSVFYSWVPRGLLGDLSALDVCLVFTIDIWRHCLKACEAYKSENLAQTMKLNHKFNTVASLSMPPCVIRQPTSVKSLIYGNVITKALTRPIATLSISLMVSRITAKASWPTLPSGRR